MKRMLIALAAAGLVAGALPASADEAAFKKAGCAKCHQAEKKGKGSVASLVPDKAGEKQPESHQRPNFMHTHSDDVGPECEKCHGTPLKHGKQGGNFCANPACHGRTWPGMDLTAEPPKKAAAEPAKPAAAEPAKTG